MKKPFSTPHHDVQYSATWTSYQTTYLYDAASERHGRFHISRLVASVLAQAVQTMFDVNKRVPKLIGDSKVLLLFDGGEFDGGHGTLDM